ncbi:PAS domain-containing protein [Caballeronia sp. BR00000012568055]|uniref:PAS domain-containing protein n=1 Tax=Caballeronia sp. BR00000012568055 TaxID=2918761 RepID=UPI0023F90857|nr:PAS domain-containing protein [Caballeronia sp. BR00000012568055]
MSSIQTPSSQAYGLEVIPFPCCLIQVDGNIVASNGLANALFGIDVNATRSCTLQSHLQADDAAALLGALWSSSDPFELDCRVSDTSGTSRWFMLSARPIESSSVSTWLCSFIDIHARKAHEIALARELRIRDGMFDASVDCIKVITADGSLTHMNSAGCQALGVSADSPFGMTWVDLLPESVREPGKHAMAMARAGHPARFPGSSQLPGEPPRYFFVESEVGVGSKFRICLPECV